MTRATRLRIPHPPYLARLALRTVFIWVLLQVALALFGAGMVMLERLPSFWGIFPTLGVPGILTMTDRRVANETLLFANLGAASAWCWAVALLTSFALDGIAAFLVNAA